MNKFDRASLAFFSFAIVCFKKSTMNIKLSVNQQKVFFWLYFNCKKIQYDFISSII